MPGSRALIALAAALPAAAAAQEAVTFGTNWLPQPEHGGYYQALADGTWAACGLDVTIVPGGPQVNNQAQLMAGRLDFYMGGMMTGLSAVEQGIPMVLLSADFQKDPQVLISHPGAAASFGELAALDSYIIGDQGFVTFFKWLEEAHGFDPAKRQPYTFNPAPFVANPRSLQQGYVTSEPFAVEQAAGFKPDVWLLADQGYPSYGQMTMTMQETIDTRPEAVRCFVEGTAKGWAAFLYGDNGAAIEAIKAANPDLTDAQIAYSIEALKENGIVDSGDALETGIGTMSDARMAEFYETMVAAGAVPEGLDFRRAYTLDFANSGASLEVKKALVPE